MVWMESPGNSVPFIGPSARWVLAETDLTEIVVVMRKEDMAGWRHLWALLRPVLLLCLIVTMGCAGQPLTPSDGDGPEPECTVDADCETGEGCRGGECVVVECASDGDCMPNEVCEDSSCVTSPEPRIEIGFTELDSGAYRVITDGQVMPLFTAFQGGSHIYVTLRALGFPYSEGGTVDVEVAQIVTLLDTGAVLNEFTQTIEFTEIEESRIERESRFVFLEAVQADLDGQTVTLSFTLTAQEDDSIVAGINQTVVLERTQG